MIIYFLLPPYYCTGVTVSFIGFSSWMGNPLAAPLPPGGQERTAVLTHPTQSLFFCSSLFLKTGYFSGTKIENNPGFI